MTRSTSPAEGPGSASTVDGAGMVSVPAFAHAAPISHGIFRVARLHRMIAGQLLRRVGLHPGQELVMMHLWERGPQRQIDLIRLLDSDAATMTRSVRRLEQAGFVRRRPSDTDKRAVIVEPTAASHALRREVEQVWSELEGITVADSTPEERAAALCVMERLERQLTRWASAER
ncbi:MarR family winged helix-turn-helix transcriptional regulator [Streptomyces uncialis]|uniref:MarR family winged helix-turn-helix transcriptional regulator n=1 Tax=Streptomyces uncialis TaxID=1048205 RepID=UPI003F4D0470